MAYKVTDHGDGTLSVGCGCRGKKDVTMTVEHVQRMASENHDIDKAAAAVGVPGAQRSGRRAMNAVMAWAVDGGHVAIDDVPNGWTVKGTQ